MKYSYSAALVATFLALFTTGSDGQKFVKGLKSFQDRKTCKGCIYPQYAFPKVPVMDVNSWDMACRSPDMVTKPNAFKINSDDVLVIEFENDVKLDYISKKQNAGGAQNIWGPCVVYMAEAKDTSKPLKWFKIFEYAGDKDAWCSEKIATLGALNVPMKADLKSGDYIVRAEVIALNTADKLSSEGYSMGAQFYPSCGLVTLTNVKGGKKLPTNTVTIPGMYNATSPSLLLEDGIVNTKAVSYSIPGPNEYAPPKDGHTEMYAQPLNPAYLVDNTIPGP
ncbi:hypothetical protein GGH95_000868 [Coemansia sp. RSA 1836]|nr:hypothetical protein GGH95_000868 [Coemansia sp. RSA 1836]